MENPLVDRQFEGQTNERRRCARIRGVGDPLETPLVDRQFEGHRDVWKRDEDVKIKRIKIRDERKLKEFIVTIG